MSGIYQQIRTRTGCTPERAREFIAQGMLLNVLLAMRAPEHAGADPDLAELSACAFGDEILSGDGFAELAGQAGAARDDLVS
jgi:hypothetical protein